MIRLRLPRLSPARFVIGGLLAIAAVPKLSDPASFASTVVAYELPGRCWLAVAWVLPWIELITAIALLAVRPLRKGGWLLTVVLFTLFAIALASALLRGLPIRCGCVPGLGDRPITWSHVLADLGLAAFCATRLHREIHDHSPGLTK